MTPQIKFHLDQMVEEMEGIAYREKNGHPTEERKRALADYRGRALREMSYSHSGWTIEKRSEVLDMWAQTAFAAKNPTV